MTPDELTTACYNGGVDWAAATHEETGEPGWLLHWTNPNGPDGEDVRHVTAKALPDLEWPAILQAVIDGQDVTHVTRIVGYYSATKNWNKSKIGELKDRRRGNYSLAGSESKPMSNAAIDPEIAAMVAGASADASRRIAVEDAAAQRIPGPCSYCGDADHWRPDCPEIAAVMKGAKGLDPVEVSGTDAGHPATDQKMTGDAGSIPAASTDTREVA